MAKLTHSDLTSIIGAETSAITTINDNGALTETAMENTLSRDGTSPNTMSADLDMNSQDVNNVGTLRATAVHSGGVAISTAGISWKGAWVTTTVYAVDEGVSNGGSSFICILAHTAGATDDEPGVGAVTTTYWNKFANKGDTGSAGGDAKADNVFRIQDNGDATKEFAFEVSGIATGTTRTWTVPNINVTFGAYADTMLNVADEAAFKTATNLEAGTDFNAYHALLNDIAGLTLTNGDILYYDGSNIVKLDNGTSGQFLQTKGVAAPVWASGGFGESDPEQSTPQASYVAEGLTGRTQEIIFTLQPATDAVALYLTVGHGGTPTYLAGTVYDAVGVGRDDGANTKDIDLASQAQITLSTVDGVGNASDEWISGRITIYNFDETEESHYTGVVALNDPGAGQSHMVAVGGSIRYSTNALTAVKLAFSSGNIAAGYMTVNKLD